MDPPVTCLRLCKPLQKELLPHLASTYLLLPQASGLGRRSLMRSAAHTASDCSSCLCCQQEFTRYTLDEAAGDQQAPLFVRTSIGNPFSPSNNATVLHERSTYHLPLMMTPLKITMFVLYSTPLSSGLPVQLHVFAVGFFFATCRQPIPAIATCHQLTCRRRSQRHRAMG